MVMAKKKTAPEEPVSEPEGGLTLRRCIGSARYGFEAHDAPIEDFPAQPSQKDGLGRMCKVHWRQYTAGLARDAKARKAAAQPVEQEPAGGETVATGVEGEEVATG
jgi:hypothetical protein